MAGKRENAPKRRPKIVWEVDILTAYSRAIIVYRSESPEAHSVAAERLEAEREAAP